MLKRGWGVAEISGDLLGEAPPATGDSGHAEWAEWLRSRHASLWGRMHRRRRRRAAFTKLGATMPAVGRMSLRIADKLEADGLSDPAWLRRHPVESMLRLIPDRFKGTFWQRLGLPLRPDRWALQPQTLELPMISGGAVSADAGESANGRTRVLVLHPYLIAGGAETVVLSLLTHMDRERFDLHLMTTEDIPGLSKESPWLPRFAEQTDSIWQLHGFLDPRYHLRFLIDFVVSRNIDVVVISLSILGYHALPQLRMSCPRTAVVDLLHAEAPYVPMDHIRLAARYRDLIDHRVVTTETVRQVQVAKYGEVPERIAVIPNGVDTQVTFNPALQPSGAFRNRSGIPHAKRLGLFYGRLVDEKQPMHIVEVADRMREREDLVFAIIGTGPERDAVEREIARRELRNVVLCPPEDGIAEPLADATFVFFPSKREGLPMAGIEALAMGRPVVASKVGGWTDLIDDGIDGFLVENGDFDGYARVISSLLDDTALCDRMSEAGRMKATHDYDVRACAKKWEGLLQSVADATLDARAATPR
jgi:glycosyltransferase involved in cell wall biosynthesis